MEQRTIEIGSFKIGNKLPLALLAGPCQIESRQHAIDMAGAMVEITGELGINYIFKASFDKANRTSINGARGVGLEEGMLTFEEIKKLYNNVPIVTDVHEKEQCGIVAQYVDMLQIPAFLVPGRPTWWSLPPKPARSSTLKKVSSVHPGI